MLFDGRSFRTSQLKSPKNMFRRKIGPNLSLNLYTLEKLHLDFFSFSLFTFNMIYLVLFFQKCNFPPISVIITDRLKETDVGLCKSQEAQQIICVDIEMRADELFHPQLHLSTKVKNTYISSTVLIVLV